MRVSKNYNGPSYIRLGKGGDKIISKNELGFSIGKGILMHIPKDILIISTGVLTAHALEAIDLLKKLNIYAGLIHCHTIKPLDEKLILKYARSVNKVVIIEEHLKSGGLGTVITEFLSDTLGQSIPSILRLGIPDSFPDKYGSQDELLQYYGLDSHSIFKSISTFVSKDNIKAA